VALGEEVTALSDSPVALVKEARNGDEKAFAELAVMYGDASYGVAKQTMKHRYS